MEPARPPEPSLCPECGDPVRCGALLGKERCWCNDLPAVEPRVGSGQPACLCERCLRRRIEQAKAAGEEP
jgi:hypothetical protein